MENKINGLTAEQYRVLYLRAFSYLEDLVIQAERAMLDVEELRLSMRGQIPNVDKTQAEYQIIRLIDRPEMKEQMAQWFHEKWGVPLEAYLESMDDCLTTKKPVPQWYVAIEGKRIIGGLGVIENDFHDRKDLAPNICAVYTEEDKRCNGVAGALLNYVCTDMKTKGLDRLYLVTDHTSFYERYGWEFLCMVQGDEGPDLTRMYIHRE